MRASFSLLVLLVVGEEDASLLQTASVRHNILTLINGLQRNPSIEIKKYVSDAPAAEALIQRAVERSTSQTVAANFMALPKEEQERLIEFGRTSPEAHEVFAKLSPEARQAALLVVERHLDSAMLEKGTTNKAVDKKGKKGSACNTVQAKKLVESLDFGFPVSTPQILKILGKVGERTPVRSIMALFDAQPKSDSLQIPTSINSSQCKKVETNVKLLKENPCYSLSFQALPYTHNGKKMANICFEASQKVAKNAHEEEEMTADQRSLYQTQWDVCSTEIAQAVWRALDLPWGNQTNQTSEERDGTANCSSDTWGLDLPNQEIFDVLPPKMSACQDDWANVTTEEDCKKAAGFLTLLPDDDSNVTVHNESYFSYGWKVTAFKYSGVKVIKYSERPSGCYFWNKKSKVVFNSFKNGKPKGGRRPICSSK